MRQITALYFLLNFFYVFFIAEYAHNFSHHLSDFDQGQNKHKHGLSCFRNNPSSIGHEADRLIGHSKHTEFKNYHGPCLFNEQLTVIKGLKLTNLDNCGEISFFHFVANDLIPYYQSLGTQSDYNYPRSRAPPIFS